MTAAIAPRRRGYLVRPDAALTEPCARPGCAHTEGQHLLCGCQGTRSGEPCNCRGFALPAPECPHCRRVFDHVWKFDAHMRFRTAECVAAEQRAIADAAAKQRAREFRTRKAAV